MEDKITAWIARDKNGELTFYETKPIKVIESGIWTCSESDNITTLFGDEFLFKFPEVKWEDEEPTEVELTIKIKE